MDNSLTNTIKPKRKTNYIKKYKGHIKFYIKNGILYEQYKELRIVNNRIITKVDIMTDDDNCSDWCLIYIYKEYI